MPTFAENLKNARIAEKLTQSQLAVLVGTSNAIVSRHERGVTKPFWREVVRYAQALHLKPLDLKGSE